MQSHLQVYGHLQIIADLQTVANAHKLVDEIAPKLKGRSSGHLRIERTDTRRGDNAQLAKVSFVDNLKEAPVAKPAKSTEPRAKSTAAKTKKPATKKAQDSKLSAKDSKK